MKITECYTDHTKNDYISIKDARYIGDFAIPLTFNDSHGVLVDFNPFLEQAKHPSIKKYLGEGKFKSFRLKDGNLDWNDFEMCFPIMDLYKNIILKETHDFML